MVSKLVIYHRILSALPLSRKWTKTPLRAPRPVHGRTVLICFIAFFSVVIGVNAIMIGVALTTFGGVEAGSAYRAGLAYQSEIVAAEQQASRHWKVAAHAERDGTGSTTIDLEAADADGAPLGGLIASVRLAHPSNARLDRTVILVERDAGRFYGAVDAHAGQWTLVIDLMRGDDRVFRSRNRITLR